jgi:capping protein alpha
LSSPRAGRWRGSFKIPLALDSINGKLQIQVHYYEDGNVQLNSTKDFSSTIEGGDVKTKIASIVKLILKYDAQFQTGINLNFAEASVNTFKVLRRALPITKNKIEWPSILAYKVGEELVSNK